MNNAREEFILNFSFYIYIIYIPAVVVAVWGCLWDEGLEREFRGFFLEVRKGENALDWNAKGREGKSK